MFNSILWKMRDLTSRRPFCTISHFPTSGGKNAKKWIIVIINIKNITGDGCIFRINREDSQCTFTKQEDGRPNWTLISKRLRSAKIWKLATFGDNELPTSSEESHLDYGTGTLPSQLATAIWRSSALLLVQWLEIRHNWC